jgi:hypothetical protein
MSFKINQELSKELELSEEQVQKINTFGADQVANLQKSWDDELKENGNKYAEGILSGAAEKVQKETGIEREKGEKLADYFSRSGQSFLSNKQTELDKLKNDYEEKIKGVKDGSKLKEELDTYKAKVAELEESAGFKEKFENLNQEHLSLKKQMAYTSIRPNFPESANKYEVQAKWDNFVKSIEEKYNIENVEGEWKAIDKENQYKTKPLSDLVKESEEIQSLLEAKKDEGGKGFPGKAVSEKKIDGLPFAVPTNATSSELSKLINEYLDKQGVSKTSNDRAKRFAELHKKAKEGLSK